MKSQVFKGLDGKIYRVDSPLEILVDGNIVRLPQISTESSCLEIVDHMIMIVAAEPPYLNPRDKYWQLAHLTDLRQVVLEENDGNPFFTYLNNLDRLDDPLSRARAIDVFNLIFIHIRGLWLDSSRKNERDKIMPTGNSTKAAAFKSVANYLTPRFNSHYFNGNVYECHIPESSALVVSGYIDNVKLRPGTKFHIVQTRCHESGDFDSAGYDVEVINKTLNAQYVVEFTIPGRLLAQDDDLQTSHGVTKGVHSISVPSSWISGVVSKGPITTPLRTFDVQESDLLKQAVVNLNEEADIQSLLKLYDHKRIQQAAADKLSQHPRLGLTQPLIDYLSPKTNFLELGEEVSFLDGLDWAKGRLPNAKITLKVRENAILYNLVPEVNRNINWLFEKKRLKTTAFISMVLSNNNLNEREDASVHRGCFCPDYYLQDIADPDHREVLRQKIMQHL